MGYIIDCCVIVLVAIFVCFGYKRGMVRSILDLLSMVLSFIVARCFSPIISNAIFNMFFRRAITDNIQKTLTDSVGLDQAGVVISTFPSFVQNSLEKYGISREIISSKLTQTSDVAAIRVTDTISPIFIAIIEVIVFPCVVIALMIALRFVIRSMSRILRLPVLRQLDQLGGVCLGALKGTVVVFLLVFIMRSLIPVWAELRAFVMNNINDTFMFKAIYYSDWINSFFQIINNTGV